jgi:hypothetical protein
VKYWITCSASLRPQLERLGVRIGSVERMGIATDLSQLKGCTVPEDKLDALQDLWNDSKLMFGEEDTPAAAFINDLTERIAEKVGVPKFVLNRPLPPANRKVAVKRKVAIKRVQS